MAKGEKAYLGEFTGSRIRVSSRETSALKDQIRRAAVSSMSNLAEGFERGRPGEFHQFLSIAKGSCAELRTQLYVALNAGYLDSSEFEVLMNQATEVGQIPGGLRVSVEKRREARFRPLSPKLITHHSLLITHHSLLITVLK